VLRNIAKLGPELLLNVSDTYTMCVDSGLSAVAAVSPLNSLVELCLSYVIILSATRCLVHHLRLIVSLILLFTIC